MLNHWHVCPLKNESGTTIIEVIIAMMLFALIMLYGVSFFFYGNKSSARASERKCALQLAIDHIEYLKTSGYTGIPLSFTDTYTNPDSGIVYTRTQDACVVNAADEKYSVITESITWINGGTANLLNLHTIICQK